MEERRERRQNKGIVGSGAALPTGATSGLKQTRQILLHCYAHRLRGSPQNARRFVLIFQYLSGTGIAYMKGIIAFKTCFLS